MHARTFLASACLVLGFTLQPARAAPPPGYAFLPYDQALRTAEKDGRPIFVYFGREGCPTCDQTNRESLADPELRQAFHERYVLSYVDAEGGARLTLPSGERVTEMDLNARLGVLGTPTFFYLLPTGEPVLKRAGFQSAADFRLYDRYVREGHYKTQTLAQFRESVQ
jgi:thioredoxin-related protein